LTHEEKRSRLDLSGITLDTGVPMRRTLLDLYLAVVQNAHRTHPNPLPHTTLRHLLNELRELGVPLDNDAVCLVFAKHIFGGTIAELAPGCWLNYVPNGEGVRYEDLCGAGARSGRPIGMATNRWEPEAFLLRDETGSLESRAHSLQTRFRDLLESKLAS